MRSALLAGLAALAASGAPAPDIATRGAVKGTVAWAGQDVPRRPVLRVPAGLANGPIRGAELVVNPDSRGVANVFVWLTDTDGGRPPVPAALAKPAKPAVEIDQPMFAFEPHALAMREGQTLVVKNSAA